MTSISVKTDLIKLDMVVKDIHHLWSEIPSPYTHPKAILAESRAVLRSDVKKSLKLAEKARKLFQRESVVATRYNQISLGIQESGESAKRHNIQYMQLLSQGDYQGAEKILDTLVREVSTTGVESGLLTARIVSSGDSVCTVSFANGGDYSLSVTEMSATAASGKVSTEPRNTFTIGPRSSRDVVVHSSPPIHVTARYITHGRSDSLDEELSE